MSRPDLVVFVTGTGTGVGKTWVSARVLEAWRDRGLSVAARKPVQSFDANDDPGLRDAAVLARASGERAEEVCPPARHYPVAMAPPMAAEVLGRPPWTAAELANGLQWPDGVRAGIVEGAGGLRSPLSSDGDTLDLIGLIVPDVTVVVAEAGLGTIHLVRSAIDALAAQERSAIVALNRAGEAGELGERNARWLSERDGYAVAVGPEALVDRLSAFEAGQPGP